MVDPSFQQEKGILILTHHGKKNYSSTIHFTHCHFSAAENCTVVNLGHKLCVLKAVKAGQMGGNLEQHTEEVHTRPHSMHYFTTFDV